MLKVEKAQQDEEELFSLRKKSKEQNDKIKRQQVQMNSIKTEIHAQAQIQKQWVSASSGISTTMNAFSATFHQQQERREDRRRIHD